MTTITPHIKTHMSGGVTEERIYHVTVPISQIPEKMFYMPLRESSQEPLEQVGALGAELIEELSKVPGVESIFIKPYSVVIRLGKAFNWSEVEKRVLEIVLACFGNDATNVKITDLNNP